MIEYVRSEAQLRPAQQNALTDLKRTVQAARSSKPERITNNTLIRIAVDGLLEHQDGICGDTEDELRESFLTHLATAKKSRSR